MHGKKNRDLLIISFALFSMFFGAGNVIFPPFLGTISGSNFIKSGLGFIITGVGLPILGVIAISRSGNLKEFSNRVFNNFHLLLGTLVMIAIGPLLAIPKTAALTYEIGVVSLIPNANMIISIAIFFALTLFFSINSKNVLDYLGTILTPLLIITLATLIIKGVLFPISMPQILENPATFSRGFEEGYQTMDALASMMFAGTILSNIRRRGYEGENATKMSAKTGVFAGLGLLFVYFGLLYIAACMNPEQTSTMSTSEIITSLATQVLGKYGSIFLSAIIGLACLTTSVGLTITAGEYFQEITKGRLKYKFVVVFTCVFSCFIAYLGLDKIIAYSAPVLSALYPTTIILIVFNALGLKNDFLYKGACIPVLIYSIPKVLISNEMIEKVDKIYPLYSHTFGWVPLAVAGGIIGIIIGKIRKGK